jgi:hypothetical protein
MSLYSRGHMVRLLLLKPEELFYSFQEDPPDAMTQYKAYEHGASDAMRSTKAIGFW